VAISINQITSGTALLINNDVYLVTEYHHVKPGKGSAFVRVKLKNLKKDLVLERTFRTSDKLEDVSIDEREFEFLYAAGDAYHFMDHVTYEETIVHEDVITSDVIRFLKHNLEVTAVCQGNKVLKILLPTFITAEITETEPGFKGDSSRAGTKPATIETGAGVQVPLFVNRGDVVKIDTRTGLYVERI